MSEIEESLLKFRAKMVIHKASQQLSTCSEEDRITGLSLRAYYLGCEHSSAEINPFQYFEHPLQETLIRSFDRGISTSKNTEIATI